MNIFLKILIGTGLFGFIFFYTENLTTSISSTLISAIANTFVEKILSWFSSSSQNASGIKSDKTLSENITSNNQSSNIAIGNNNQFCFSSDQIHQEKEYQEKIQFIKALNAAWEDLDYNGPHKGNKNIPFKTASIRQLLEYVIEPFALSD